MSWKHLSESTPKARKPHQCDLCEMPIPVGEKHVCRTGTQGGEFVTMRMHAGCERLTRDWDQCDWESRDPAEFREHLEAR